VYLSASIKIHTIEIHMVKTTKVPQKVVLFPVHTGGFYSLHVGSSEYFSVAIFISKRNEKKYKKSV